MWDLVCVDVLAVVLCEFVVELDVVNVEAEVGVGRRFWGGVGNLVAIGDDARPGEVNEEDEEDNFAVELYVEGAWGIVDEGLSLGPLLDAVSNEVGELEVVDPETVVDDWGLDPDILFVLSEEGLVSELMVWYVVVPETENVEFTGEIGDVVEAVVKLCSGVDTFVVEVTINEDVSVLPEELIILLEVDDLNSVISVEEVIGEPMDENLVLIVVDEVSKVVLETLMVDGTIEGVKEAALE